MKRMMSISLSIFLIIWAVILYAGDTKANAGDMGLYAGSWVGSSLAVFNDDPYTDAQYTMESLFFNTEGNGSVTILTVTDVAKTEWTPSDVVATETKYTIYPSDIKISADGGYLSIISKQTDPITGADVTEGRRCYGMSQNDGKYMEMKCISVYSIQGGIYELNEKVVKTIDYKRK